MNSALGVNIAGYVNGEFGIGEGVRATIRSLEAAGIPLVINNFTLSPHRKLDKTYQNFTQENPYPINLIQVNADEVKNFIRYAGSGYLEGRYNIGFWAWELPTFPPEWTPAFSLFNEIWTYSNHCAEAIARVSPIPVLKMMPSIDLKPPQLNKETLNIPKDKFVFLFIFDFFSRMERKNPLAVIEAFKRAFGGENPEAILVIKTSNSNHFSEQVKQFNSALADCCSIQHIDGYLSKSEINALLDNCDCYISLHRSEGFGLTMAEAMFYGKPVIATAYSSNTEFMNIGNSFLVKYKLKEIPSDFGPYKRGNIWAEPDIEHAATLMRAVFENYEEAQQIGANAADEIKALLSPKTIGSQMRNRLEYISHLTNDFTTFFQSQIPSGTPLEISTPQLITIEKQSQGQEQLANPPLVSICIPTYNGQAFLAEALESAFSQTYPNLEVIVSDDGSTDKTVEIAQSFQDKTSLDYRIILHRNYGIAPNWNFCVSQAKGEYIKFLFQDDLLAPDCIAKMVELAQKDPQIGLVFSPRDIVMAKESESNPLFLAAYQSIRELYKSWSKLTAIQWGRDLLLDPNFLKNPINKIGEPTTVLIATHVFQEIGLFDPGLSQYLDLDMWFRIMGKYKIGFVNQSLSFLRIHAGQQTWKNYAAGESRQDVRRLYNKMLQSPVYNFLTQEVKAQVRFKVDGKSHPSFPQLATLVEDYQKSPQTSALENLQEARYQLAQVWLNLPAEQWQTAYLGELGKALKLLWGSGIKYEKLTEMEQNFMAGIAATIAQKGSGVSKAIHYHLVAMLYRHAYQLPIEYKNAAIPRWFLDDFLEFLFESPRYFQEIGEVAQYSHYLQGLIDYLYYPIFESPSVAEVWRYLADFVANNATLAPLLNETGLNFNLIEQKLTKIREFSLKNQGFILDKPWGKWQNGSGKLRLGILLDTLGNNRDSFAIIPTFEYLDLTRFEIILYYFSIDDSKVVSYCQNRVSRLVQLPDRLPEQVEAIRQDDLDILLIGANLVNATPALTQLCLHRLGRVQVSTSSTLPTATGASNIDYHIVGNLARPQPPGAEPSRPKLLTLPGSGLCFSAPVSTEVATVQPTRSSWGAGDRSIVYLSAADFAKMIPELRETWAKIIATVANSVLVLCPFRPNRGSYPVMPFFKQMRSLFAKYGIDKQRLAIVKNLRSRTDLQACIQLADIYLDSFPYTGAASLVAPLIAGVPPVVREGNATQERQAAAILRELELPELVTKSENSYIELSAALGSNPELRQRYRQQIQQKMAGNPSFLDSRTYCVQLGALLEKIFRER